MPFFCTISAVIAFVLLHTSQASAIETTQFETVQLPTLVFPISVCDTRTSDHDAQDEQRVCPLLPNVPRGEIAAGGSETLSPSILTRLSLYRGANTKNSKNKDDDIIFVDNTIASGAPLAARSYLERTFPLMCLCLFFCFSLVSEDSSDEPLSSPTKKMSTRKRRSKLSPQSTLGDTDLSFLTDDESEIVSRNDDDDDSYTESRRPKKSKRTPKARTPRSPRKLTKTRSKSSRSRSSRRNRYYDSTSSEPEEEEENYLEDDDYMESSDNYNEASSNPNNDSVTPRNDNVPNSDDDSSVNVSAPTPIPYAACSPLDL